MAKRRKDESSGDVRGTPASFADALSGDASVKPIDRGKLTAVPLSTPKSPKGSPASPTASPPGAWKPGPKPRNRGASIARATRSQLRDLRAGKILPQATIDLHGFRRDAAYRRLCNAVARAISSGKNCVLVVHGKGLRSEGGQAVLRDALDDWLARVPLVEQVIGSSRAQPRDGGAGATLLLLRNPRSTGRADPGD